MKYQAAFKKAKGYKRKKAMWFLATPLSVVRT